MAFEKSVEGTESSHQAELNNSRNDTYHKSYGSEVTSSLRPETALFFFFNNFLFSSFLPSFKITITRLVLVFLSLPCSL